MKKKVDELLVKQGELQVCLQEMEQKFDKYVIGFVLVELKFIGGQVVEFDELKEYVKEGNFKKSIIIQVKVVISVVNSVGVVVVLDCLVGIVILLEQCFIVCDLFLFGCIFLNLIQYIKEIGFVNNVVMVIEGMKKFELSIIMIEV